MTNREIDADGVRHVGYPVGPDAPVDLLPMADLAAGRRHLAGELCECGPTVVACGDGKVFVHQSP